MALIRKIAAQAYRTFSKGSNATDLAFSQNLSKLQELVQRLTATDLNFDESLVHSNYDPRSSVAPVTYIDLWADETFSMGIFVLKPGTRLPMHDHPDMHGLIRVIHGCMNVWSYTVLDWKTETYPRLPSTSRRLAPKRRRQTRMIGQILKAKLLSDFVSGDRVDVNSEPLLLTPTEGNIHEIKASGGPAAFFDILAPPYDDLPTGPRQCNYYKELLTSCVNPSDKISAGLAAVNSDDDGRYLVCIEPPEDYWTDGAQYSGPSFDPYDSSIDI